MSDRKERMRLVEPLWAALHPDEPEEREQPDDGAPRGAGAPEDGDAARGSRAARAALLPIAAVRLLAGGLRRAARALGLRARRPAPPASPGDD